MRAVLPTSSGIADLSLEDRTVVETLLDFTHERAVVAEPGSFSTAIVAEGGTSRWASAEFIKLVGDPSSSSDCRSLAKRVRAEGRASGLVATPDRGSVVIQALPGSAAVEWPLPAAAREALAEAGGRVLLVAFAPSRSLGLALVAANVLGLAPREADLAAALLEAPSLQVAADRAGMSLETAKDALARACKRVGVRGASELVGKLLDLSCGPRDGGAPDLIRTLGLTEAEARVAAATADGSSIEETAATLGLTSATVKSYRKSIFAKTGTSRDRDLRRLVAEASGLAGLSVASEIVLDDRLAGERLRVFARAEGRRVALIDYGPASGSPCLVMHGFTTGRRLPRAFVDILQIDGWRPVVIQRPGFGLTDAATGDYLAAAADDMAATLDHLGVEGGAVLARDGGAAVALAFAERHPGRVTHGVQLNPRSTRDRPPRASGLLIGALSRVLLTQPAVIVAVCEFARQRSSTRNLSRLFNRLGAGIENDRLMAERPEVATHLVCDAQGMMARTAQGLIDELRLYADGWRAPAQLPAVSWRVAWGSDLWSESEGEAWSAAGAQTRVIDGMGLLPAYTHPAALAALLSA